MDRLPAVAAGTKEEEPHGCGKCPCCRAVRQLLTIESGEEICAEGEIPI